VIYQYGFKAGKFFVRVRTRKLHGKRRRQEMKIIKDGYWYCPHCNKDVDPKNVTYQEYHTSCGRLVEFINTSNEVKKIYGLLKQDIEALKLLQDKAFKYDAICYVLRNGIFDNRKGGNFDIQLAVDIYESYLEESE
jgi:hypothetical protein